MQVLLDLVVKDYPALDALRGRLTALSPYAVEMRYEDLNPPREEADLACETVRELRRIVGSLLPPEIFAA